MRPSVLLLAAVAAVLLAAGAAAAQPLVHITWEGVPQPGNARWGPQGNCWSDRTGAGAHVDDAGQTVTFSDTRDEAACVVYTQTLPQLGATRSITVVFDAQRERGMLTVSVWDRSGMLAQQVVGNGRHVLEASSASSLLEPRIEWSFHDASPRGADAARVQVAELRVLAAGGAPYVMRGQEMTQSWLGSQLVVEHLWRFEVPAGPEGWTPRMQLEIPDDYIVKGVAGRDVSTLHGSDGRTHTALEGAIGDEVVVRTLAPRLPGDGGGLVVLFALSVLALASTAAAALRQLLKMHLRRNAGILPWAAMAVALGVDVVSLLRLLDGGTWRLMVQTPMHPVGILLYGGLALLVLLNLGLLLAFAGLKNRRMRARLEAQTRESEHLRRVNQALDEFAAGLAHDIKGPLAGARVALELVLEEPGELPEAKRRVLGEAHRSISSLQRMAHEMLDLAEVDEASEPEQEVDLHEALDEARTILQPSLSRHDVRFELGVLPVVRGRRLQIVRLFQNLIENTLKHGQAPRPCIRIEAERDGDEHVVRFTDNGRGLPPGTHHEIFRASHRGPGDGYGLGLALVRRIVERHGGAIHAVSEPGEGTTFSFTLPAASLPTGEVPPSSVPAGPAPSAPGKPS